MIKEDFEKLEKDLIENFAKIQVEMDKQDSSFKGDNTMRMWATPYEGQIVLGQKGLMAVTQIQIIDALIRLQQIKPTTKKAL